MTKLVVIRRVREVLAGACEEPAEELVRQGEALVEIGKALKGMSVAEARATLAAVAAMEDVRRPEAQRRHPSLISTAPGEPEPRATPGTNYSEPAAPGKAER